MAPTINLLADTPPGYTWIEGTLDLEAEDFTREHIRGLRRGLAALCGLPAASLGIVSIARWAPIVVLAIPATFAERIVEAFELSDPAVLAAFGDLPVQSLKLDDASAQRFSRPPPPSARDDFWGRLEVILMILMILWIVRLFFAFS